MDVNPFQAHIVNLEAQREQESRAEQERVNKYNAEQWAYIRDVIADEKDLHKRREREKKERERERRRNRNPHKKKESLVTFIVKELFS